MDAPHPAIRPEPANTSSLAIHDAVLRWYDRKARDLPWRHADTSAWAVLVSEVMLQQTPVARVLPVWLDWMGRWPTPAALAAEPSGEAVRAWGRLGYPRRALRLHAAATEIVERHGGEVPGGYEELLALSGVGDYTAAAVASFAFGRSHTVIDTNVRRVFARLVSGQQYPAVSLTAAERRLADSLVPEHEAPKWAVAVMELGALICTARTARCEQCPVAQHCAWLAAGQPEYDGPARKGQAFEGTDRQVRGRLMAVLRESDGPVPKHQLDTVWPDDAQRERCLDSLLDDKLADVLPDGRFALP
jgi:A/G-specific adenine glycosylase